VKDFSPRIVFFCCSWGADAIASLGNGASDTNKYSSKVIRTMCSGRVDPAFVLHSFSNGADGVMVTGCPPGDCHYETGNHKTLRRITLLKGMLSQLGIEPERLRLEWVSPEETSKLQDAAMEFADTITKLGPIAEEVVS
jgi:F420-non-reducing hydrogenase iron-sulfur subunit